MASATSEGEQRAKRQRATDDQPRLRVATRGVSRRAENAPSLAHLTWTLREYRWTVLATVVLSVGIAALWLLLAPPSYESTAVIQVDGHAKTVPGFSHVSPLFEDQSPAEAEMRIMRSRPLLQSVIEDLRLDLDVHPSTVPIIGKALMRLHRRPELAPPLFGLTNRAWGGERIAVARLEVSADLLDEPLTLTALGEGRFEIAKQRPTRTVLLGGEVGKPATSTLGASHVEIRVDELVARPGTEFVVRKLRTTKTVDLLHRDLRIAEQGHAGVVELSLEGSDAARVAAIVNRIANAYVSRTVERTSQDAMRTLRALEEQLPALKASMDRAEAALHAFRQQNGSVDLPFQGDSLVTEGAELNRRISEAQAQAAELHKRYGDGLPDVIAIEERLKSLRAQRATLDQRMRSHPDMDLEAGRLTRAARTATELYLNVQLRAQELRVVNAGWIGSVRVLEAAAPALEPSSPKRGVALGLGLLLGIAGGVWAAFMRKGMENGVEDPEEIEAATGVRLFGAIPRSRVQRSLERRRGRGVAEALAAAAPGDRAVEDLRSVRTSVQFALTRAENNVITISGPAPRVGKSFVSVNLAHLLATAGGRVLLVDADLRRGQLQRTFGVERSPGLSDVLRGTAALDDAIRGTDVPRLSFLPTGNLPSDPAELTAGARTQELLRDVSRRFDIVIVDTPPVLWVTDFALIGRYAGVNLLVVRAREQTLREIRFTLRRLTQNGVTIGGIILNDVRPARGRYGRFGEYPLYSPEDARSP